MLDTRGFVAETNATHLFLVRQNQLATSRVLACPAGITRATILEICATEEISCAETDLRVEEFYDADEVFCSGTMGELAAITTIDGRTIGTGRVGPMTERLTALFRELTAREGEPVA